MLRRSPIADVHRWRGLAGRLVLTNSIKKVCTWSRPLETSAVQTTRTTRGHGLVVDSVRASVCIKASTVMYHMDQGHREGRKHTDLGHEEGTNQC